MSMWYTGEDIGWIATLAAVGLVSLFAGGSYLVYLLVDHLHWVS